MVVKFINALNQLQHMIFACYIKRDYFQKKYEYEEQIHRLRIKLFRQMKRVRMLSNRSQINALENLYEIIFSLNIYKLRVTDHATFEVCENELKLITQCISKIIDACFHRKSSDDIGHLFEQFTSAIENLEELYRSTLQVVSYEPIVFLFFVQNMMSLRDGLKLFVREFSYA